MKVAGHISNEINRSIRVQRLRKFKIYRVTGHKSRHYEFYLTVTVSSPASFPNTYVFQGVSSC